MRTAEKEVLALLDTWEKSHNDKNTLAKSAEEVFLNAEYLVDITFRNKLSSLDMKESKIGWEYVLESNKKVWEFIPSNLLQTLSSMHYEWITFEDIPKMRKLLDAEINSAIQAWKEWENYRNNLDWEKRKKEVEKIGWPYIV
jgi:hypothetical protein